MRTPTRLAACLLLLTQVGCVGAHRKIQKFHDAWSHGNLPVAETEVDRLIGENAGVDPLLVTESNGLDLGIDPALGDTALYMMEKAMVRLAEGDMDSAIDLLRASRDCLEPRHANLDVVAFFAAILLDDTAMPYAGRDYEHLVLRTLLTLIDLVGAEGDAYAYALQITEKQEQILGTPFGLIEDEEGETVGLDVRAEYERLGIGAYLEGVVHEDRGFHDEALKAYERAREWSDPLHAIDDAIATCRGERHAPGTGLVHVFHLVGRGPRLFPAEHPVTDQALDLAKLGALFGEVPYSVLLQAPVLVPNVIVYDQALAPLTITVDGLETETETLLDLNAVAEQELDAMMPWILARAVTRRAFKTYSSAATAAQMREDGNTVGATMLEVMASASTAFEQADARNWTTLPAEIQVARLRLPAGVRTLEFSNGETLDVDVTAGRASYVLALRPRSKRAGYVFLDPGSEPREPDALAGE